MYRMVNGMPMGLISGLGKTVHSSAPIRPLQGQEAGASPDIFEISWLQPIPT